MKFERESWRKLYVAESLEHRRRSIFTRGIRDYLLRHAEPDGTLIRQSADPIADMADALGVRSSERRQFKACIEDLIEIGYLTMSDGRLWITRFRDAQTARTPGAKRTAEWKQRQREAAKHPETSPGDVTSSVTGDASGDVTGDTTGDVTKRRDETRRDENTPNLSAAVTAPPEPEPDPPPDPEPIADRSRRVLENPFEGQFENSPEWPEVKTAARALSLGMRELKLRNDVSRDSDLRAILSLYADGYSVADLEKAGERAKSSEYFRRLKNPGPAAFTPAVVRRLLNDSPPEDPTESRPGPRSIDISELGIPGLAVGDEGL